MTLSRWTFIKDCSALATTVFKTIGIGLAALIVILPLSSSANDLLFTLAALKNDIKTEGPSIGTVDSQMTSLNFKAGYVLTNGLYVGGTYDSRTDESNSGKAERTSLGASIGYHNSGWYLDGTYYLSSSRTVGSLEYREGSGFGADVGHRFTVSGPLQLGLQVSYRSFTYNKLNSTTQTNKISSELMPMLLIGLVF